MCKEGKKGTKLKGGYMMGIPSNIDGNSMKPKLIVNGKGEVIQSMIPRIAVSIKDKSEDETTPRNIVIDDIIRYQINNSDKTLSGITETVIGFNAEDAAGIIESNTKTAVEKYQESERTRWKNRGDSSNSTTSTLCVWDDKIDSIIIELESKYRAIGIRSDYIGCQIIAKEISKNGVLLNTDVAVLREASEEQLLRYTKLIESFLKPERKMNFLHFYTQLKCIFIPLYDRSYRLHNLYSRMKDNWNKLPFRGVSEDILSQYMCRAEINYDNVNNRMKLLKKLNIDEVIVRLANVFKDTLYIKFYPIEHERRRLSFVVTDKSKKHKILEIEPNFADGEIYMLTIRKIKLSSINSYFGVMKLLKGSFEHKILPSWDEYFMLLAVITSLRSKDPSTQVGAVIVKDNNMIGAGYNGMCTGIDENAVSWDKKNTFNEANKYPYVVHAELNAILNSTQICKGATLYVTKYPCQECAKAIIQAGIKTVVVNEPQSSTVQVSNKLFLLSNVKVKHITLSEISNYISL